MREKLAAEGEYFELDLLDKPPCMTLEQMLEKRQRYISVRLRNFQDKLKKLPRTDPNIEYMRVKLARMKAGVLATDFILYTCERIGTAHRLVYGRRIKTLPSGVTVYVPSGAMPDKRAKQQRLSRHNTLVKKTLTKNFSFRLDQYIRKHLPILRQYYKFEDNLVPPLREGEDAFSLFGMFEDSYFRKAVVKPVTGATSNDLRAAVEHELKSRAEGKKFNLNVIQHHVSHKETTSISSYQAGRAFLDELYADIMPDV